MSNDLNTDIGLALAFCLFKFRCQTSFSCPPLSSAAAVHPFQFGLSQWRMTPSSVPISLFPVEFNRDGNPDVPQTLPLSRWQTHAPKITRDLHAGSVIPLADDETNLQICSSEFGTLCAPPNGSFEKVLKVAWTSTGWKIQQQPAGASYLRGVLYFVDSVNYRRKSLCNLYRRAFFAVVCPPPLLFSHSSSVQVHHHNACCCCCFIPSISTAAINRGRRSPRPTLSILQHKTIVYFNSPLLTSFVLERCQHPHNFYKFFCQID